MTFIKLCHGEEINEPQIQEKMHLIFTNIFADA